MPNYHRNLPAGTYLRMVGVDGIHVILREQMKGDWAHVEHVKLDGTADRRYAGGWSGMLDAEKWRIVGQPRER